MWLLFINFIVVNIIKVVSEIAQKSSSKVVSFNVDIDNDHAMGPTAYSSYYIIVLPLSTELA